MPIYEYTCGDCGRDFEALVRGAEQPECPRCGKSNLLKRLSVPAAHVAGSADAHCPVKDACGMSNRCGGGCGIPEGF